jgi:hypothetical protein
MPIQKITVMKRSISTHKQNVEDIMNLPETQEHVFPRRGLKKMTTRASLICQRNEGCKTHKH